MAFSYKKHGNMMKLIEIIKTKEADR